METSVTEDPGVSSILLFQRQRHKLSAPTVFFEVYAYLHYKFSYFLRRMLMSMTTKKNEYKKAVILFSYLGSYEVLGHLSTQV